MQGIIASEGGGGDAGWRAEGEGDGFAKTAEGEGGGIECEREGYGGREEEGKGIGRECEGEGGTNGVAAAGGEREGGGMFWFAKTAEGEGRGVK